MVRVWNASFDISHETHGSREVSSLFYKGFHSRFVWKNDVVGGEAICTGLLGESISWINFFLDLLYVAVITNIVIIFVSCELNFPTIAVVYGITTALYKFRWTIDEYSIRFFQDDLFHRIIYFIYIMGVYFMGANISNLFSIGHGVESVHRLLSSSSKQCSVDYYYYTQYAAGFLICNVAMCVLFGVACFQDATGKVTEQYFYRIVLLFVSMILIIVSTHYFNETTTIALLVAAPEIELAIIIAVAFFRKYFNYVGNVGKIHYPVNYLVIQERLGIYVLLFLGEGVIKIMEMVSKQSNYAYIYSIASMLLIFLFGVQYFDRVQRREDEIHACKRDLFWGLVYLQGCHRFLTLCILFVTTGIAEDTDKGGFLLSIGCGLTSLLMIYMRVLHKGIAHKISNFRRVLYLIVELLGCVAHFLVALGDTNQISKGDRVVIHTFILLFYVMLDVVGPVFYLLLCKKTTNEGLVSA